MLALYRCGRQADALQVYQQTRRLLLDQLGLEPIRELHDLEKAILRQDPGLTAPRRAASGAAPTAALRRPRVLIVAGSLLLAAALGGALFELVGGSGASGLARVEANALGAIDPKTNQVVAQVPVGTDPAHVIYGHGALWVTNEGDNTISRVDPRTRRQVRVIPVGATPNGLAASRSSIWVATGKGIAVIDPVFNVISRTFKVKGRPPGSGYPFPSAPTTIAFTPSAAWIATSTGGLGSRLVRADPTTGRATASLLVANGPTSMTSSTTGLWVTDLFEDKVSRIDPTGALLDVIPVGHSPTAAAAGFGAVWVADSDDDDVKRIDPQTRSVLTTIPVGRHPVAVAVGSGSVWVASQYDGTISRIDPRSNKVVKKINIAGSPVGIALSPGLVWVTVQSNLRASTEVGHGGVVRIDGRPNTDPAQSGLDFDAGQMQYATCANLLHYPDKPAPAGLRLEPEIARALPDISADGRTYTFTLRSGYRFSPRSNESVTPATFKYTLERTLNPKAKSPALFGGYLNDIVGARAYEHGRATHISGVIAHGMRLTFKLTKPAGDFPARITMPFFCPVPSNTPIDPKGVPIASAGPYYVASATSRRLVLRRNPNYSGPRPRRPSEIVYDRAGSPEKGVERVLRGEVDYAPVWNAYADKLNRRYGSNTKTGRRRFFVNRIQAIDAFALNTSRPLFSDSRLRRAVSYAIDRRALAREGSFFLGEGGPLSSVPTDQYLPSVLRGYEDVSLYPLTPDLPRARRLAGRKHRRAVLYTCNFSPCPQEAEILKRNLAAIGITVESREYVGGNLGERENRPGEPYDLALVTWADDYPDPYDSLNVLFDGKLASLRINTSHFDDPAYNRELEAASRLSGAARYRAYARLDAELARNAAPLVAFGNETARDFFSARIGCQLYQPVIGMDLGALCVRG
jgi:peptide/nickel transport system substrate-binding protein